ncbi:MAG: disulfide bond formation protein DsbA [Micrococcales bacterium 73-13]|nr:MAG: disulfide bond formation protein DsbA [Micrococcales bacterium 73-13]
MKVTIVTGALLIVAVLAAIIYAAVTRPAPVTPSDATGEGGALSVTRENSHVLDNVGDDAPTLVEFLDFECEACGAFYPVVEQIREAYDGKINYVFRYFPIPSHFNSMNAAIAVEAASQQGRVEDMYNKLFQTQTEWAEQQVSQADVFRGFAQELGLDMAKYDAAVADPATKTRVEFDFNEGRSLGVNSTPTFFLDGEKLELTKLTDLTDALDRAIAG